MTSRGGCYSAAGLLRERGIDILSPYLNTAAADGTPGAKPLSGLARAFFYAGARSLLVSHWPVGDIASEKLVKSLFSEDNRKLPRAKALSQAMTTVRADPTFAHPALWAPFTIVGEGR